MLRSKLNPPSIYVYIPTHLSEAHQKCFFLIQRFVLRLTIHWIGEFEQAAFVGLCASPCLENEALAQRFLTSRKPSGALSVISSHCCNSKETDRNSGKSLPFSARHFACICVCVCVCVNDFFFFLASLTCARKTSGIISVLSLATVLTYELYEFPIVFLLLDF